MIIKTSVFIVGNDEEGLAPFWAGDQSFDDLADQLLSFLYVGGRIVVVCIRRQFDKVRIDERDTGEAAGSRKLEKAEDGIVKAGDVRRIKGMAFKEPQETIAVLEISP